MKDLKIYFIEGGPAVMYPILYLLIVIFLLFILGLILKKRKIIDLISSLGWITLIWGVTAQAINLYATFENIQSAGGINPELMLVILKISLIPTIFGAIVFLFARIEIIILILLKKEEN